MDKDSVLNFLVSFLGDLCRSPRLLSEILDLIAETGCEKEFFKTLVLRLRTLAMLGARATQAKEFEPIGNGLFSMHLTGQNYNIRILYSFLPNREPALLLAFYERAGKQKTDYSPYIEPAKARFQELKKEMETHENK
ncbi:MAG: hypothetical protein MR778_00710 [Clostridiales bacterium]|nr:hypothetical protein [Clostridiales bacterium]MDD6935861.1 hypothetical protein [Clostridiales bacterium]MDY2961620.1 hypothetical protein [Oscillospiraceae bacterium]